MYFFKMRAVLLGTVSLVLVLASSHSALASSSSPLLRSASKKRKDDVHCGCHTWHNVTAVKGEWKAIISTIDEDASFLRLDCTEYNPNGSSRGSFNVSSSPQSPQASFGFRFGPNADFNIMYVLTLLRTDVPTVAKAADHLNETETSAKSPPSSAVSRRRRQLMPADQMGCVFVIGAAGPAEPDVRAENYNGAICMWTRNEGVGENYIVDFAG